MRSRWWTSWTTPTSSSCTLPLSPAMTSSWSWSSKSVFLLLPPSHVGATELQASFSCSVEGGELFDRIIDENYNLTELDTVLFIRQICEGLQYMHKMYILHLDLKVTPFFLCIIFIHVPALLFLFLYPKSFYFVVFQPENILCVNRATNKIKIIDFGLARR